MTPKLMLILVCLLLPVAWASAQDAAPALPDYWPTHGWRTATPAEHGLNTDLLAAVPALIEKEMPFVHSILIVRHGYLVFEQYFAGYNETSLNEMMSVTKSVTSALVGIALERGDIQNVDVTFASSPSRR